MERAPHFIMLRYIIIRSIHAQVAGGIFNRAVWQNSIALWTIFITNRQQLLKNWCRIP